MPPLSSAQKPLTQNVDESRTDDTTITFMEVYRAYQWSGVCWRYLSWRKANPDAMESGYTAVFLEQYKTKIGIAGLYADEYQMSDEQAQVLGHYIARCDAAFELAALESGSNVSILPAQLLELLMDMTPKTEKERQIVHLLKTERALTQIRRQISQAEAGSNTWTDEQIQQAWARVRTLYQQIKDTDEVSRQAIEAEVKSIKDKLNNQIAHDYSQVEGLMNDVLQQLNEARALLNSKDPDVFYLAKTTAEYYPGLYGLGVNLGGVFGYDLMTRYPQYRYLTPGEELMKTLDLSVSGLLASYLVTEAGLLYYCSLGADCESSSVLMTQFCLGLIVELNTHHSACGRDLVGYFYDAFLTAGQKEDVNRLLDWVVVFYDS